MGLIKAHPIFGINIDPSTAGVKLALQLARLADVSSVDLVTIQDHPYNPDFLDTWTLLTSLASRTERVHFSTNVLNSPLRPPAMMAKMAATLDVITGGRLELGVGAGGYVEGMQAWGGVVGKNPGERYKAFKEYVEILQGILTKAGGNFSYKGEFYQVGEITSGPTPFHRIPLWIGVGGPRMLRLAGRKADGWLIGTPYILPEQLEEVNRFLDEGAIQSGQKPEEIRRGYNLFGVIHSHSEDRIRFNRPGIIQGTAQYWIETLMRFHNKYRHDTFIFWPVAGNEESQIKIFVDEVMPEVRSQIREAQMSPVK